MGEATGARTAVRIAAAAMVCIAALACGDDGAGDDAGAGGDGASLLAGVPHAGVVSDWRNGRLDLVDLDALQEGATRGDALIASIDLSDRVQGPLNAEVTPDGKLALVSLSDGFFGLNALAGTLVGASNIPTDGGEVLFVDLERFEVVASVATGDGPMGIAFVEGATRAIVAHFGTTYLSVIDLPSRSVVDEIEVGVFGEEIDLDDAAEVGILSYSSAGNVRTFGTGDVGATLSEGIELSGDAAGVAFFPGTTSAYVVQAPMPLTGAQGGHTVVDVADPSAPVVTDDVRSASAPVAYPVAAVPARGSVAVPSSTNNTLVVDEVALRDDGTVEVVQQLEVGSAGSLLGAYGAIADDDGRVLLSVPANREIVVVDLDAGASFAVPWGGSDAGPMDLAPIP